MLQAVLDRTKLDNAWHKKVKLMYVGISVVATSRNDDHGRTLLDRMRTFVSSLDHQTAKHGLSIELVMVEWNPVTDRPSLRDVLPRPKSDLLVRYITVPPELHATYANAAQIHLFQMIAKNVGIRRAMGGYVLATNVDLLFSDELCLCLKAETLSQDTMYRANRCDVPVEVLGLSGAEERLEFCQSHVLRRVGRRPAARTMRASWRGLFKHLSGVGRDRNITRSLVDTDACGDFTMMHKSAWDSIRGYPELAMYSIYLDGLGCHTASAMGFRQVIFPAEACSYHIDHTAGWASMTTEEKMLTMVRKPALDYVTYLEAVDKIWRTRTPLQINDANWGLRGMVLDESIVSSKNASRN